MNTHVGLDRYLEKLLPYLHDKDVIDVCVNKPGEVYVRKHGLWLAHSCPDLTFENSVMLARLASQNSEQPDQDENYPLIAATLPDGSRMQCVLPPATLKNRVIFGIRKYRKCDMTFAEYVKRGGLTHVQEDYAKTQAGKDQKRLRQLYKDHNYEEFLVEAIRQRRTFLVSGSTGAGKTWLLNMLMSLIPLSERMVTIEDRDEMQILQPNWAPLLFARQSFTGQAHKPQDLVEALLRLIPGRIIMGELRGAEAYDWLHASNTGHPGSGATIHANSAYDALKRLALLILQAHTGMSLPEIESLVHNIIDFVVHTDQVGPDDWGATEIYFNDRAVAA